MTASVTVALGVSGLVWLADPAQPAWWLLPAWTWLPGGTWAGVGQIVSGVAGLAIVVWARLALVPEESTSRDMKTLRGSGR